MISHGPAFSGMRHFLFVLPPIAVLAGIGFDAMLAWLETRGARARGRGHDRAGGLAGLARQLMVRLHPYEYLYFNPLVGGLQGAAQRYDTDYWVNAMHEMVVELESHLDREKPARPAIAISSRSAASGCRSRRKPKPATAGCNGRPTATRRISSSRRPTRAATTPSTAR